VNEQGYRKQLLVQQIQSHRERMGLEIERLKEANPITPMLQVARGAAGLWDAVSPAVSALTSGSSALGKTAGIGLSVVLPGLIRIIAAIFGRKK
jgi:hypothetical protein